MTTLDELLDETAGEPPRPLDLDRVHRRSRTLRRIHLAVVCMVPLAAIIAAVAATITIDQTDEGAVATFDLPQIDEVVGEYMPDGAPVWIVHDRDSSIYVLNASDPTERMPFGTWATHWCPGGRYFESPLAALFELDGTYLGGPSRYGMTQREFDVDEEEGTIEVGASADEPMGRRGDIETNRLRWASRCEGGDLVAHPEFARTQTLWDD